MQFPRARLSSASYVDQLRTLVRPPCLLIRLQFSRGGAVAERGEDLVELRELNRARAVPIKLREEQIDVGAHGGGMLDAEEPITLKEVAHIFGTPLDQGTVEDNAIVCPLHRSAFDLRTGKLVGPWCPAPPLVGPPVPPPGAAPGTRSRALRLAAPAGRSVSVSGDG